MVSKKIVVGLVALMFAASGCATSGTGPGGMSQGTCTALGGLLGAGAGVVAGGANHGDDDESRAAVGGGIGLLVGAVAGNLLCATPPVPKQPPSIRVSANPSSGTAPLTTELRAVGSDPDGNIVSYAWDLGDGTTATGARVSHTYGSPGRYTATATATDNDGMNGSARVQVNATEKMMPPPPPKTARRIVLRGVNFDFDKADIRSDAQVILDAAVEVLKENPGVRVQVGGHTDATGPEAYNQGLSERRAAAVRSYLVSNGVSSGSLTTAGYGESSPVATNDTRDGRAQNRRVELNVQQ